LLDNCNRTSDEKGLLVAHYGVSVEVLFENGSRRMVKVKRNSGHVVGDSVLVNGEVLKRLPRRTELRRRDARGGIHLVAANLDVLGIVIAPLSPAGFVDRAIVAARSAGLEPFLIVNKCDLDEAVELGASIDATYGECLHIFRISTITRSGLVPLNQYLSKGHRGVFIGNTGVGKSSLMNAICPESNLKVGETSAYKGMGRHTTTVSTLHRLTGGGELVDTPGFRDFGLVEITAEELAEYFPGFEEHGKTVCRFHNCRHRSEPGCGVIRLMEQGIITAERYQAYLALLDEVETAESAAKTRCYR